MGSISKTKGTRVSKEKGTINPVVAARHLQEYKNEKGYTSVSSMQSNEKLGVKGIGLDRRTITKILNASDESYDGATFEQIAKATGIIKEYWQGLTECKTAEEYTVELKQRQQVIDDFEAEAATLDLYNAWVENRTKQMEQVFSFFGFHYNFNRAMDDFAGIAENTFPGGHFIRSYEEHEEHQLDYVEMEELKKRIHHEIKMACFEADQRRKEHKK